MINGERLQQRLEQLTVARHADAQGPTPDDVPGWMATTAQTRTAQHKRYCQAQDHLALLQAANQRRSPSERRPLDKIVVSTGDPEAALGVDKDHVFRPLYTMQTIRDVDSPLILSYDVFAQATDAGTLLPMRARTEQLTGRRLQEVLVDSGYVTGVDLAVCAAESVAVRSLERKRPECLAGEYALYEGAIAVGARAGCVSLSSRATPEAERTGKASAQWGA